MKTLWSENLSILISVLEQLQSTNVCIWPHKSIQPVNFQLSHYSLPRQTKSKLSIQSAFTKMTIDKATKLKCIQILLREIYEAWRSARSDDFWIMEKFIAISKCLESSNMFIVLIKDNAALLKYFSESEPFTRTSIYYKIIYAPLSHQPLSIYFNRCSKFKNFKSSLLENKKGLKIMN